MTLVWAGRGPLGAWWWGELGGGVEVCVGRWVGERAPAGPQGKCVCVFHGVFA